MTVRASGPLYDGRAAAAVQDFIDDSRREVAQQGYADVMGNLNQSIKHPTPYYETQVNIRDEHDTSIVNDRGIVYGPWLEGTGSRNFPKTRFKGYTNWRRARHQLAREVPRIVNTVLKRHLSKMGG
jgi:hypothetical protein